MRWGMFPRLAAMCEVLSAKALVQFWETRPIVLLKHSFHRQPRIPEHGFRWRWNNTSISECLSSEQERKIDNIWFAEKISYARFVHKTWKEPAGELDQTLSAGVDFSVLTMVFSCGIIREDHMCSSLEGSGHVASCCAWLWKWPSTGAAEDKEKLKYVWSRISVGIIYVPLCWCCFKLVLTAPRRLSVH